MNDPVRIEELAEGYEDCAAYWRLLKATVAAQIASDTAAALRAYAVLLGQLPGLLEDILLEHSYPHEKEAGWMVHSCMSDQEHALKELVALGVYELHPERPALFRRAAEAARAKGE